MSTLGKQIKETRIKKKKSQKDLATLMGISPQYLSNIESGKSILAGDKIKAASTALKVRSGVLADLAVADYKATLTKQMKTKRV